MMVIRLAVFALILVSAETVNRGIGRIVFQLFCNFEEVIEEYSEFLLKK